MAPFETTEFKEEEVEDDFWKQDGNEPIHHYDYTKEGVYKSIVTGQILFSTKYEYNGGEPLPCFTQPAAGAPLAESDESYITQPIRGMMWLKDYKGEEN